MFLKGMLRVQNKLHSPGNICDMLSITTENNFDSRFVKTNKNCVYRNALTIGDYEESHFRGLKSNSYYVTALYTYLYLIFLCKEMCYLRCRVAQIILLAVDERMVIHYQSNYCGLRCQVPLFACIACENDKFTSLNFNAQILIRVHITTLRY